MPEENPPEMGEDAPTEDPPPESNTDWEAESKRLKALLNKETDYRKRNDAKVRELEPLAKRAKELEDAGKSDMERLTSELQGHTVRADKAEQELMRLRVAVRKGLTEVQARRLVGSSEEELEADADDLMASFRPATPEPEPEPEPRSDNSRRRPQERLRPGAVPDADTEPEETDPRKLAAMVPRRFLS